MEIKYSKPFQYPCCISTDCPQRETCLHAWAWQHHDPQALTVNIINPDRISTDDHCKHYISNEPQRYARGFSNFQQHLYPGQYSEFARILKAHFGHTAYYMRRRGETPMPPSEQQYIRQVTKQVGGPDNLDFDSYEYRLNWYAE